MAANSPRIHRESEGDYGLQILKMCLKVDCFAGLLSLRWIRFSGWQNGKKRFVLFLSQYTALMPFEAWNARRFSGRNEVYGRFSSVLLVLWN